MEIKKKNTKENVRDMEGKLRNLKCVFNRHQEEII